MKVDIPYLYFMTYMPKGKRIPRGVYLACTNPVTVDIPEIDDFSAPVAIELTVRDYDGDWPYKTVEYRWFAGKLWEKVRHDSRGGGFGRPVSLERFKKKLRRSIHGDWHEDHPLFPPLRHTVHFENDFDQKVLDAGFERRNDRYPYITENESYPRSGPHVTKKEMKDIIEVVYQDNNKKTRDYVRKVASRYIMMDGTPWTIAVEPLWAIFQSAHWREGPSCYIRVENEYHTNLGWRFQYPIDMQREAMEAAGHLASIRGEKEYAVKDGDTYLIPPMNNERAVVHLPFAIKRNPALDVGKKDEVLKAMDTLEKQDRNDHFAISLRTLAARAGYARTDRSRI